MRYVTESGAVLDTNTLIQLYSSNWREARAEGFSVEETNTFYRDHTGTRFIVKETRNRKDFSIIPFMPSRYRKVGPPKCFAANGSLTVFYLRTLGVDEDRIIEILDHMVKPGVEERVMV